MPTENINYLTQEQKSHVLSECMNYISVNALPSGLTKQEWRDAVDEVDVWIAENLLQQLDDSLSENIQEGLSVQQKVKMIFEIVKAQLGNF